MKKTVIILFVLLAWFSINSCQKSGSGHGPAPRPIVSITQTPLNILLPENCMQVFTITNTGPKGSTLSFTVKDDGALQGFLEFGGVSSGSLASGASVNIDVEINPSFENDQSLIGAVLVLDVYTPQASNFTKIPVPVNVKSINSIAQSLVGTWSGTWSGQTGTTTPVEPAEPVSGTWTLNVTAIDTASKTITGSIKWQGNDAYWDFVYVTPYPAVSSATLTAVPVNDDIQLDASNTSFFYDGGKPGQNTCVQSVIGLTITNGNGTNDSANGDDLGRFIADFNVVLNKIAGTGTNLFNTTPTANTGQGSSGGVAGSKQQQ